MNRARVSWPAVAAFVAISFGLAWLAALPLWLGDGLATPAAPLALVAMMLTPLIATIVVTFAFRVPRRDRARFLGLWPLRPAKRVIGLTALALFAPIVLVLASVAIAAALGWVELDLVGFGAFAATLEAVGGELPPIPLGVLVALQFATIPLAALINSIPAFGEEIGWRGWLLPALMPLGTWPALLISGALWGLWHAPAILLGYNYGLTDITGVLLMTAACIVWGVLFGWSRLRSGSVWPAVVGHGSLNAAAGAVLMLAAADAPIDMTLAGPLGAAGMIVVAIVVAALVAAGQFRHQPELAAPRAAAATSDATPA